MRRGMPLPSTPVRQRVLAGAFPLAPGARRCLAGSPDQTSTDQTSTDQTSTDQTSTDQTGSVQPARLAP